MKASLLLLLSLLFFFAASAQWSQVYQDNNANLMHAAFPTENFGYVAAFDTGGAFVLRTTDGGNNWNKKYIPGWDFVDKVVMRDSLKGYLIKGGAPGRILKSLDGFNTFTQFSTDSSFVVLSLQLLSDSTGYYLNNAARLRRFKNNGANFSHVIDTLVDAANLQFVSPQTAYLDGGAKLLRTTDTGISWQVINNNLGFMCAAFAFADSSHAYFSDGNIIYKSDDAGLSFQQQLNFSGAYSFATEANFCIAANDTGNIVWTINGGQNWQYETSGINFLVAEPYRVFRAPGGACFLFSQFCGEIRRREPIALSLMNILPEQDIRIFPNPVRSELFISSSTGFHQAEFQLSDLNGRLIWQKRNTNGRQVIFQPDHLQPGAYCLRITALNKMPYSQLVLFE